MMIILNDIVNHFLSCHKQGSYHFILYDWKTWNQWRHVVCWPTWKVALSPSKIFFFFILLEWFFRHATCTVYRTIPRYFCWYWPGRWWCHIWKPFILRLLTLIVFCKSFLSKLSYCESFITLSFFHYVCHLLHSYVVESMQ